MSDADMKLRRMFQRRAYMEGWARAAGENRKGYKLPDRDVVKAFMRGTADGLAARRAAEAAFEEHMRATAFGYIDGEEVAP